MGIFNKKSKNLPDLFPDDELDNSLVNYNTVLDWLVGLSDADYQKVIKVTDIYRAANKGADTVLGLKSDPSTSIFERTVQDPIIIKKSEDLDFLTDDEPPVRKGK